MKGNKLIKKWPLISEETVYQTRVFNVLKRISQSPETKENKEFYALSSSNWAVVIAVTEKNEIVLVKQFRHGSQEFSLELPGGVIEPKQTPLEAAKRELREETGYSAENWQELAPLRSNPAIIDNHVYAFIAYKAQKNYQTDFDDDEDIIISLANKKLLEQYVSNGQINHAIMVAIIGLFFLKDKNND